MTEKLNGAEVPDMGLEFMSKLIGKRVVSYTIKPGTAPGENYMSVLYCFKCVLEGHEVLYGIAKCYPSHPSRQEFLNKSNMFWNELSIYKDFIPALKAFHENLGVQLNLAFAPLISGEAIDYGKGKVNEERLKGIYAGKVFNPFDNYIMMVDLKNTYGFRTANRFLGLDVDEVSLVMKEHSKLHALSWAYKLKNGIQNLSDKFPCLEFVTSAEDDEMFKDMVEDSWKSALAILKSVDNINPQILSAVEKFLRNMRDIMKHKFLDVNNPPTAPLESYLRVPVENNGTKSVPWSVVIHGDCWTNNLLFRYDEVTEKAAELVLIDLQLMREACPTTDLVYLIYTSTTANFRNNHFDDMLELYYISFKSYCDQLGVEYLPGFSLESLKQRFHVSKLVEIMMVVWALPIMLKDSKDAQDLDKIDPTVVIGEMFSNLNDTVGNTLFKERLLGICQDLFNDGVI